MLTLRKLYEGRNQQIPPKHQQKEPDDENETQYLSINFAHLNTLRLRMRKLFALNRNLKNT